MIKAVFFDLDGVLADTEIMHQRLNEEFLTLTHSPVPPERFYCLIGAHKSMNLWGKIVEGVDMSESAEEFKAKLHEFKRKRLAEMDYSKLVFKEVPEVLKKLKEQGIRLACASSSNINHIQTVLCSRDLISLFDVVATCDDFAKSKPAPDIYCYCMNTLKLRPEECLVVEDSTIGINAGKAAEMRVAARRDYNFGMDQHKADYWLDDLTELFTIISQCNGN